MTAQYNQLCPAARTMEIVGDRWTLLIVRDLLQGPKRFSEIQASLAGAAPNLLSDRLKRLVEAGILARGEGARAPYALTESGRELAPIVVGFFQWGVKHLGAPVDLRHRECGTPVQVHIWCPSCERAVERSDCDRVHRG
jgi:DNA-binding HxlR family transcriptional regulator